MTCQRCGMHYGEKGHNCIVPLSYRSGLTKRQATQLTHEWLEFLRLWPVRVGDLR